MICKLNLVIFKYQFALLNIKLSLFIDILSIFILNPI